MNMKLTVCEDNEAVIKIVLKKRSTAMRHVLRTHRVNLDFMFEILDQRGVSLKYVNTKNQVADFLTKGFTRKETWDHLVRIAFLTKIPEKTQTNKTLVASVSALGLELQNSLDYERMWSWRQCGRQRAE